MLNNLVKTLLVSTVCLLSAACSQQDNEIVNNEEPDVYTVRLGWKGEILNITEEPLTRTTTDNLYGIQVYAMPYSGNGIWANYAYGLFDNPDNISIDLVKGFKYKFVATMVVGGKYKLLFWDDLRYDLPFSTRGNLTFLSNQFTYSSTNYFDYLGWGSSWLPNAETNYYHPNTDRYYGELTDYVPNANAEENAQIFMKRTSFGAKFIAQGRLAISGTLEILMESAPKMEKDLSESDKSISDIFTFESVKRAFDYSEDGYTETIEVTFNWKQFGGTVIPLGAYPITYKRNKTTVVTINMENISDMNDTESLGLVITEEGEMEVDSDYNQTIGW